MVKHFSQKFLPVHLCSCVFIVPWINPKWANVRNDPHRRQSTLCSSLSWLVEFILLKSTPPNLIPNHAIARFFNRTILVFPGKSLAEGYQTVKMMNGRLCSIERHQRTERDNHSSVKDSGAVDIPTINVNISSKRWVLISICPDSTL